MPPWLSTCNTSRNRRCCSGGNSGAVEELTGSGLSSAFGTRAWMLFLVRQLEWVHRNQGRLVDGSWYLGGDRLTTGVMPAGTRSHLIVNQARKKSVSLRG